MTLFRKNYKEAMNDIKPDAAFVESVIAASKKRRPPFHTRYVKYAAAAAAAVVVVSGTILAMPMLNRVEQDNDGVISETTAVETAAPAKDAAPLPTPDADGAAAEKTETIPASEGGTNSTGNQTNTKPSQNKTSTAAFGSISQDAAAKTETPSEPKWEEPQKSESEPAKPQTEQPKENNAAAAPTEQESDTATSEAAAESAGGGDAAVMKSIAMDETAEARENKMPVGAAQYGEPADIYSVSSALQAEIGGGDIPTPSGYRCTSATQRGCTFVNDEGAVITVTIGYGEEESEPYIEEDGDNIYAAFTSFGLSVTINASGADRSAVEEIINSLR